jgi:hypothetical protein
MIVRSADVHSVQHHRHRPRIDVGVADAAVLQVADPPLRAPHAVDDRVVPGAGNLLVERRTHFYYEPWIRDNHLIKLILSPIGSPLSSAIDTSDDGGGASIVRQKEWWAGNQLGPDDRLQIATSSALWGEQGPFDIVSEATTPFVGSTIAMVTFDDDSDRVSHPDQLIPGLGAFLTGIDVWYPATTPPDGRISFIHDQRNFSRQQVINTPNWPSSTDFMTVTYRDWVQDIDTWTQCVRAKPSPCH